jgi:putative chitinase
MNSVSEKIDERILRLLGLEDVFDLDYDTYLTELKEAMVKGSFGKNKIPDEELALLANERKRIRGKKGRFKPKKEKITASKVATTKLLKGTKNVAIVSSAIAKPDIQQQDLTGIGKPLQSIAKTLADFLNFKKKTSEEERREKESQKRTKKEEGLEGLKKGISAVSGAAKKMLAPFQDIIDRIWKFIFFTLLGRAFTQLMGWLGDPANKKKIEVLGRFLKDWWPALAFAAGLFLTPFGAFIRSTIGLLRTFIPQMASFMLAHPILFGTTAAAVGGGIAGAALEKNLKNVDEKLLQRRIQESKDKGKPLSKQEIEKIRLDQLQKRVQDIQGTNLPGSALLASGGVVPRFSMGGINFGTGYDGIDGNTGEKVSGFGPDTQAIIAQPGEIVINKKTVDAVGADHFLGLNRMHGGPGANKPKMGRLYNTGGTIQRFNSGGMVGKPKSPLSGTSKFGDLPLIKAANSAGIKGLELASFLSQMSHETGGYKWSTELGGGSSSYSGGKKYKGRGYIQLTHDYNYKKYGDKLGIDLVNNPDLATNSDIAAKIAVMYWKENVRPSVGNNWNDVFSASRAINNPSASSPKGINGYEDRVSKFNQYKEKLNSGALNIEGPAKPKSKPKGKSSNFLSNFASFMPTMLPFMGGGLVKENTGMNLPGATADRQLARLQPGEYVLPVDTVNRLGVSLIDKLVAGTDSNSTPFMKSVNKPQITPLSRGNRQGMITLPPITQSASGGMGGGAAGSKVPSFSASSPSGGSERSMNAGIYGIVG